MSEHLTVLNLHVSELTQEAVRKAYRTQSLKWHPDKPNGDADKFRKVRAAYEYLRDPVNVQNTVEAARARQQYASARHRVTQEMTRESLRKERMAERLRAKEKEAAWRRAETAQASQKMQESFNANREKEYTHKYPSNYVPSSDEDAGSGSDSESAEANRLANMRNQTASVVKTIKVTRVHAQHLVVDISSDSGD